MSSKVRRFLKVFYKLFSAAAAAYSTYLLYNLLTVPWSYPILNTVTAILLIGIIIFGILTLLT